MVVDHAEVQAGTTSLDAAAGAPHGGSQAVGEGATNRSRADRVGGTGGNADVALRLGRVGRSDVGGAKDGGLEGYQEKEVL